MNDNLGLIAGIALAVVLAAILAKVAARQKASAWTGTVTAIKRRTIQGDEHELEQEEIVVHYKTEIGKKGRLRLAAHAFAQCYPGLQVGDRLVKETGEFMPKKQ